MPTAAKRLCVANNNYLIANYGNLQTSNIAENIREHKLFMKNFEFYVFA